jgi:hypothetical protein
MFKKSGCNGAKGRAVPLPTGPAPAHSHCVHRSCRCEPAGDITAGVGGVSHPDQVVAFGFGASTSQILVKGKRNGLSRFGCLPLGRRHWHPQLCRGAAQVDLRCAKTFAGNPARGDDARAPPARPQYNVRDLAIAAGVRPIAVPARAFRFGNDALGPRDSALDYPAVRSACGRFRQVSSFEDTLRHTTTKDLLPGHVPGIRSFAAPDNLFWFDFIETRDPRPATAHGYQFAPNLSRVVVDRSGVPQSCRWPSTLTVPSRPVPMLTPPSSESLGDM